MGFSAQIIQVGRKTHILSSALGDDWRSAFRSDTRAEILGKRGLSDAASAMPGHDKIESNYTKNSKNSIL